MYFRDAMDFLFFTGDERCRRELVIVFKVGSAELKQEQRASAFGNEKAFSVHRKKREEQKKRTSNLICEFDILLLLSEVQIVASFPPPIFIYQIYIQYTEIINPIFYCGIV